VANDLGMKQEAKFEEVKCEACNRSFKRILNRGNRSRQRFCIDERCKKIRSFKTGEQYKAEMDGRPGVFFCDVHKSVYKSSREYHGSAFI
jgi:hypothetical protein